MSDRTYNQSIIEVANELHHEILETMHNFIKKNNGLKNKDVMGIFLVAINQTSFDLFLMLDENKNFIEEIKNNSSNIMDLSLNLCDKIRDSKKKHWGNKRMTDEIPVVETARAIVNTVTNPSIPVFAEDLILVHQLATDAKAKLAGKHLALMDMFKWLLSLA